MELSTIRQMMAELKYSEAQKVLEFELNHHTKLPRQELVPLYLECLREQGKQFPPELILEACESGDLTWLESFPNASEEKYFLRWMKLKMKVAEANGELEELHHLISRCQIFLFDIKAPSFPHELWAYIDKFFRTDFQLRLQNLALNLLLRNAELCERQTIDLILSCFERATVKGKKEKLEAIIDVIQPYDDLFYSQLYSYFCYFLNRSPQDKVEFKKLTELVIYFDDFKPKVLLLHILDRENLQDSVKIFSLELKKHKDYDFVYLDKFFPHLKKYFVNPPPPKAEEKSDFVLSAENLKLEEKIPRTAILTTQNVETSDDENLIIQSLKYQSHTAEELVDIAVGFIQSELPLVALKACEFAIERSGSDKDFLKASYLLVTAHLQLRDFRGALDWCHRALEKAKGRDEILAFLYGESEAYLRLGLYGDAKYVLQKILQIDQNYRLTKERLAKLE